MTDITNVVDAALKAATRAIEALRAENERIKSALQDSHTVHANILRGEIALSREQALHIAGATDYDSLRSAYEELKSAWHAQTMARKDGVIALQEAENDRLRSSLSAAEERVRELVRLATQAMDYTSHASAGVGNCTEDCWAGVADELCTCGLDELCARIAAFSTKAGGGDVAPHPAIQGDES